MIYTHTHAPHRIGAHPHTDIDDTHTVPRISTRPGRKHHANNQERAGHPSMPPPAWLPVSPHARAPRVLRARGSSSYVSAFGALDDAC